MPDDLLRRKIRDFLDEDLQFGDVTSSLFAKEYMRGKRTKATITSKKPGILAGAYETKVLFRMMHCDVKKSYRDGDYFEKDQLIMTVTGNPQAILAAERTALNILMSMTGVATFVHSLKEKTKAVAPNLKIACTRKTTPGFRYFLKKSVILGGGHAHRFSLSDMVLIKDTHRALVGDDDTLMKLALERTDFSKKIEVEADTIEQAKVYSKYPVDIIMLDNFTPDMTTEFVKWLEKEGKRGKFLLESSGGITIDNIVDYAATGVDIISLSAITQTSGSGDFSLEIEIPSADGFTKVKSK